eukprot:15467004-Alexandrium_andersonii.AAC.1
MPREIAVRNAGGHTAAQAVRFAPVSSRPCSTAWSWTRPPPKARPSLAHRRHTRFRTSGDALAHR